MTTDESSEYERLREEVRKLREQLNTAEDENDRLRRASRGGEAGCGNTDHQSTDAARRQAEQEARRAEAELRRAQEQVAQLQSQLGFIGALYQTVDDDGQEDATRRRVRAVKRFLAGAFTACAAGIKTHLPRFYRECDPDESHNTDELKDGEAGFRAYVEETQRRGRQWASRLNKPWLRGKKIIGVIGGFSAGKSTLVNALIGAKEEDKLPVDMNPSTAVATYVSYGDSPSISYVRRDGRQRKLDWKEYKPKTLTKSSLGGAGLAELVKYGVMEYPCERLRGVSLLDTPGLSSGDERDSQRALEAVFDCDALLYAVDVNKGVTRQEIELLKSACIWQPLYVVLTKCDQKVSSEVREMQRYTEETLNRSGIGFAAVLTFSQDQVPSNVWGVIEAAESYDAYTDTFADDFRGDLQANANSSSQWLEEQKEAAEKAEKEYHRAIDKFNDVVGKLQDRVVEVADIPQYETHLFGDDKYEMTAEQYNKFHYRLEKIHEGAGELCRCTEAVDSSTTALSEARDWVERFEYVNQMCDELLWSFTAALKGEEA